MISVVFAVISACGRSCEHLQVQLYDMAIPHHALVNVVQARTNCEHDE
jgi:hypothetical protein